MQHNTKDRDRQKDQPGSMSSYNNREDNRPGRVEETKPPESTERQEGERPAQSGDAVRNKIGEEDV
jgi:hypothetical protein